MGKVALIASVLASAIFLLSVYLALRSQIEWENMFGAYPFWEILVYEKVVQTTEIQFLVLSVLQVVLYLSARYVAAKGIMPQNLKTQTIGMYSVALSAWLMYAIFYALAPISASVPLILILSIFLVDIALIALRTYCVANDTRIVELVRRLVKKHASALVLSAVVLIVYLSFLSCSLSEWDSFNFAEALRRFDLGAHQPHPPGYSLYVFLSEMALVITGDKLSALASISALSGALCLLPVYAIVREMFDRQTATLTCLALMSTRMYWLTSEKPITHMFGTFMITLAICLLYLGLAGKRKYFLMSWPAVGFALGARPSYFPFLGLWIYGATRDRRPRSLPLYFSLFTCAVLSWLVPTILLTGWDWFWELIRRQYVYVSMNEFIGTRYGMPPVERFLSMMARFLSTGFGAPTWLWRSLPRQFGLQNLPPVVILCLLVPLMIHGVTLGFKGNLGSKRTFLFLWIVPYSIVVYLTSTPGYPRYFLPIVPPLVIVLVSTAWSAARSMKCSRGRLNVKGKLLGALVLALISFNFIHSAGLAATIHTTEVPMVRLARHVRDNYGRNTVVIVFHEYEAFEDNPPRCRYLSAQYDRSQVVEILENLSKRNQTVLITDTSIQYVLGPTIERLGLEKVEVARFEMDPQVETEQYLIVLYALKPRSEAS